MPITASEVAVTNALKAREEARDLYSLVKDLQHRVGVLEQEVQMLSIAVKTEGEG